MPGGPLHANLIDAALHNPGYIQASDPGAVGAGRMWVDTSAGTGAWVAKIRNAADSGWEIVGSGAAGTSPLTTKGDLFGFSTVNARVPVGSNGQVPVGDSTAGLGVAYQWQALVQQVYAEYTASANLTTTIPLDDTIPQNTEGTEIVSATITPKASTHLLDITFQGFFDLNGTNYGIVSLFRDSTANALATSSNIIGSSTHFENIGLAFQVAAGSTSATTFKIRAGPVAGTMRFNGSSTARFFGGSARATLKVIEYRG